MTDAPRPGTHPHHPVPAGPSGGPPGTGQAAAEALSIRVEPADGRPVVVLRGELDIVTAEQLGRTLDEVLSGDPPAVRVDMRDLAFMDSAGVACLLRAARRTAVSLVSPSVVVRRVIEATGLASVLPIEEAP